MTGWIARLLAVPVEDEDLARRGRLLGVLLLLGSVATVAILLAFLTISLLKGGMDFFVQTAPLPVVTLTGMLLAWVLARQRGRVMAAIWLFLGVQFVTSAVAVAFFNGYYSSAQLLMVAQAIAAGMLLGPAGGVGYALLSAGWIILLFILQRTGLYRPPVLQSYDDFVLTAFGLHVVLLGLVAGLSYLAFRSLEEAYGRARMLVQSLTAERAMLEQRVIERTAALERRAVQLSTAADVGRAVASILEPAALARQVVDLVRERFDLYYVGLFLLDRAGEYAVLEAGTGEAGRIMKEQGHRLAVRGDSMVGAACAQRRARIALDVGAEAVRFDNPLLPETRSEMALPLMVGERVLGALDVQSSRPAAFSEEDMAALQLVADQVAIGLENGYLFAQTRSSLEELRQIQQVITGEAWQRFAATRPLWSRYRLGESTTPEETWQALFAQARGREEAVTSHLEEGRHVLALPIRYRGVLIGVLGLDRPQQMGDWQPQEIALGESLAERLALALENARLYEEAQQRASLEHAIRDLTDRMTASFDLETILQTTLQDLGRLVGAEGGYVELGVAG